MNRHQLLHILLTLVFGICFTFNAKAQENIAPSASELSTSFVSNWETLEAINDGYDPESSNDQTNGQYGNWGGGFNIWNWVQYEFDDYYKISGSDVYWFDNNGGILTPDSSYLAYLDPLTNDWLPVNNAIGNDVEINQYNHTEFDEILTNGIRLYMHSQEEVASGVLEWKVYGILTDSVAVNSTVTIDKVLALNTTSTITATALNKDGNPIEGYIFKLNIDIKNNVSDNNESYTINSQSYTASETGVALPATNSDGEVTFNVVIPATIDKSDGISVTVAFNAGTTSVNPNPYSLLIPGDPAPSLTPDDSDNTVDNNIDITFTDDVTWRSNILYVIVEEDTLTTSDYEITAGSLILKPSAGNSALTSSGNKDVTVISAGYEATSVTQTLLAGQPGTLTSSIEQILKFYLNSSVIIEANAFDQFNNPVEGYEFKWAAEYVNNTSTTNEEYKIAGTSVSATTSGSLPATNEDGYIRFRIVIPSTIDADDGFSLQLLNNDGVTKIGSPVNYRYNGNPGLGLKIHPEVKSEVDYSFEEGTAQSDHFIIFWGERAGPDPTNPVESASGFDPVAILDVLEDVFDCYANDIHLLDTTTENPSKYKFLVEISNTWNDESINYWALGGSTSQGVGWMGLAPAAASSGNGLAHEFTHSCQATGTNSSVGGNFHEVHANFSSIQYSEENITSVDMGRYIFTQNFPWLCGRHYYVNWYFLQHITEKYGKDFIGRCWNEGTAGNDFVQKIKELLNMDQEAVCDEFGYHALKNVTWDYKNGETIREFYTNLYSNRTTARDFTILEKINANTDR
jgi:hypothetical protein